ncbi:MAG TPA: erythromycin esterase family protein [Myxococcaceae bacterium]|nr:erythromycin esterase family protein [Myxococcaceae bacterium]
MSLTIHPGVRRLAGLVACLLVAACGTFPDTPTPEERQTLVQEIRSAALPLTGGATDYDALLAMVGDADFVLLGEASHGTHEFYQARAELTRRLIQEKGFTAVAVEGDWPSVYRLHRHVTGTLGEGDPFADLQGFPSWMWGNTDVREFVTWLADHNAQAAAAGRPQVGFYGLDLQDLPAAREQVLSYLERVDPPAAERARKRYACALAEPEDGVVPARPPACADGLKAQLEELRANGARYIGSGGEAAKQEHFSAVQNARVVQGADTYYRAAYGGTGSSWNVRDVHMADTLDELAAHVGDDGNDGRGRARIVIWAHNTHVGDARATAFAEQGELNLGQLVRTRHPGRGFLVGFTTYRGTVTASSSWGGAPELKQVNPALPDSYESLLHETGLPRFVLPLRRPTGLAPTGLTPLEGWLERGIGVVYAPRTERRSHYFEASLSDQFDAVLHFDTTRAVEPLDVPEGWRERG